MSLKMTNMARRSLSAMKKDSPEFGAIFLAWYGWDLGWRDQQRKSVPDLMPRIQEVHETLVHGAAFPLRHSDDRQQVSGISAEGTESAVVDARGGLKLACDTRVGRLPIQCHGGAKPASGLYSADQK